MTWLTHWTPEKVQAAKDRPRAFAEFCQQTIGTPWPTIKDMTILRRKIKEFFARYPQCDYHSLCRVAQWTRSRKRRPTRTWMVVEFFREAWRDGYLPELDPAEQTEASVEEGIAFALDEERRPEWRRRLLGARGVEARREAYQEWLNDRPRISVS
jgi:hypothetical protein